MYNLMKFFFLKNVCLVKMPPMHTIFKTKWKYSNPTQIHANYFSFHLHVITRLFSDSVDNLRILDKGNLVFSDTKTFLSKVRTFKQVHIDLGTGDGKYVYQQAKENPEHFFIGVDLHPEKMYHYSWKAARKPSKGGGVENLSFICSAVEKLPTSLTYAADKITINFPWASLLKGVVKPERSLLMNIVHLAKERADLEIVLNHSIFKDHAYCHSLDLPIIDLKYVATVIKPIYKQANIDLKEYKIIKAAKNKTTWGQHLVHASQRELLFLSAKITHLL